MIEKFPTEPETLKTVIEGKLVNLELDELSTGDIFRLTTYRVSEGEEWTRMIQVACGYPKARSIYH